jgi:ubiquinone/menaquinone biosynthesis C-methylase UbiE
MNAVEASANVRDQKPEKAAVPDEIPPELAANLAYYESQDAVNTYSFYRFLPEEEVLIPKYFKVGDSVLDLACGMGRTTRLLHEMGMHVRGVDRSENFVKLTNQRFPYLDIRLGSYDDIQEEDSSFTNILIALNGIDYAFPETQRVKTLKECARVLKPGGILIYSSHNLKSLHWCSPYYWRSLRWKFRNGFRAFRTRSYVWEGSECSLYNEPSYAVRQTEETGLKLVEIRGFNRFKSSRIDLYFSPYIHYVFEKPGTQQLPARRRAENNG